MTQRITGRCGSTDPAHVARRCRDCKSVYNKRWKSNAPFLPRLIRGDIAECRFCGLSADNTAGVKVLRYPLLRHIDKGGRHTSVCIGSLPICDRCVVEQGNVKAEYVPAAPERHDGLRSYDGMPTRAAS